MKTAIMILMLSVISTFADLGVTIRKTGLSETGSTSSGCAFIFFRLQANTSARIGNSSFVSLASFDLPIYGDFFSGSGGRLPAISYSLVNSNLWIMEVK